jgi:hypothetical protein
MSRSGEADLEHTDDTAPPPIEGGRIDGRVTDFEGTPLVGVRVEAAAAGGGDLDLLPVLTDGEGRFTLEGLAEGEAAYDLRFVLGRVRARTLRVPAGTRDLAVQLARPQGILLVTKMQDGAAPPDVLHVRLERRGKHGLIREYEGRHLTLRMLLWSIRPGTYTLTVWGGGYVPVQADGIAVHEGRPAPEVQLALGVRGGVIRGRVVDGRGGGRGGALVSWRPLDVPGPWSRRDRALDADGTGAFRVDGLPPGRYRVSAGELRGPFADLEVEVDEGQEVDVEVVVES